MAESEAALRALAEQVQALQQQVTQQQAAVVAQQQTMAQQQAALAALQAQVEEASTLPTRVAAATEVPGTQQGRAKTSRRRLFTAAGAAAAAATAATVIVGSGDVAHAATGSNWVLGVSNNANSPTILTNTGGSSPSVLLNVDNSAVSGGDGIHGTGGPGGSGVYGVGPEYGVFGTSYVGAGVYGLSAHGGIGVLGQAVNVTARGIQSGGQGGQFIGQQAALNLSSMATSPGVPAGSGHDTGDIYVDSNTTLWVCTAGGTPGTFVRLTSVLSTATGGAITYLSQPIRLLDTRVGATDALNTPGAPYTAGSTNPLTVAGVTYNGVTVPNPIAGCMGQITATNETGSGYIALVPHGLGFTGTDNLPFSAGETVAIWFNSALASGVLDIIVGGASTDVILDLFAVVA
ncbi:MAG: hypothetical protein ACLQUY_08770 [Ktedonobacterales bacterium]